MDAPEIAYENREFLNSNEGRTLRILAEILEPDHRFKNYDIKNTVVFFGSARIPSRENAGRSPETAGLQSLSGYYEAARELAGLITQWGMENGRQKLFICSGGGPGIMEAANRGAHEAKGKSIGLNIHLPMEQHPNPFISQELNFQFHYFFTRKLWFAFYAKALCIFPGGFGTLDEFMELLTLIQTRKVKAVPIVVFGSDYWKEIINFDALVKYGTISPEDMDLFRFADTPQEAFAFLKANITVNGS
ncbi:MAG: Rossman fold protein, TIGR00730 family [Spirochaetes bacterium GWF1_41_5]|nr:MAG: Rossman fold protein, TIGR00730 family [Spirochaetes bacterium GWF1_41_5]HBE03897.1 TIGR00730 family Rossman fold protein [Spirochaetia bacterium]